MPDTTRRRLPGTLLALAGYGAVATWVHALHLGPDTRAAFLVAVAATVVLRTLHVVAHELGHLVAALALGVRVRGVRIFGVRVFGTPLAAGPPSHVSIDLGRPQRALAPRMGVVALAGPSVNLVAAAVAATVAGDRAGTWPVRAIAVSACVTGVLIGIGNLVPFRSGTGHSDGRNALRWIVGSRRRASELAERRAVRSVAMAEYTSDAPHAPDSAGAPDGGAAAGTTAALLAAADDHRPAVAAAAMSRLMIAALRTPSPGERTAAVWDLYDRLLRVVRMPGVAPDQVRRLVAVPGTLLAMESLQQEFRPRMERDLGRAARIEDLLEAGRAAAPHDVQIRAALCLVRIVQGRSSEGAALLVGVAPGDGDARVVADAYAARALAEITLRDLAQAGRLLDAAHRLSPDAPLGRLARSTLAAAAARNG